MEILKCKGCNEEYIYTVNMPDEFRQGCKKCIVLGKVKSDYIPSIKELAEYDKKYQKSLESIRLNREVFIKKCIKLYLRPIDKILFFIFRKLADYFVDKVIIINDFEEGYQNGMYGVKIYGKHYIKTFKDVKKY